MNAERIHWLRTRCSRLFRGRKREAEMDAELQFHLEQLIAQYREEGMTERDARLAAQREFGAETAAYREEIRDTWRPPSFADLLRTFRLAMRSLARTPGFTLLAIVTLAFGIGGNTLMFSTFKSIVTKPLPYPQQEQLDRIDRVTPQNREGRISAADFLDLQREVRSYGEIAGYALGDTSVSEPGEPAEIVLAARATSNLLPTLRVQVQLGRGFEPHEQTPGNDRVVILSQRAWQNRFGGTSNVIGRIIRVDGEPHEIVGVLPVSFNDWRHLGSVDLFRPLAFDPQKTADRHSTILRVIGRRSENLGPAEARALIANFGARLATNFPELHAGSSWLTVSLPEATQARNGRTMIGMLIGLSGFVLLIACSNLANLLLARTMARAREFAVRAAIGASRAQLLRPLMAESLVLALAGGACALLVAQWGADWLRYRSTGDNGEQVIVAFDWAVFGWAFAASVLTAVAFGLAPALFALGLNVNETLKSGARGTIGSRGHRRFRHALIVGQFALAMILLAGAALYIHALDELNHRRAGWQSDNLITGRLVLPAARYSDAQKISAFHRVALERVNSLPGVAAASVSSFTPFFDWADARKFIVEGRELPPPGHEPAAVVNSISPRYFDTVRTRLLGGRAFTDRDDADAPRVFIIGQAMAAALFGNDDPIGRRITEAGTTPPQWGEIVGIVADVRSVTSEPNPVTSQLYQPMAQQPQTQNELAVRTTGVAPGPVIDSIRKAMAALDPDLPIRQLQTADATIERANYQSAVLRDMLTSFALLGLGLASLGVYGTIARTMAQRAGEFAIRFALGARIQDVTRIVLASGVKLALAGAAFGLLGAVAVSHLLAAGHPGMQFNTWPVLLGTTLLLLSVALFSCWLPARRAARINPIEALRAE
ncbi:ABC transporter permease [soil metagenome]